MSGRSTLVEISKRHFDEYNWEIKDIVRLDYYNISNASSGMDDQTDEMFLAYMY